MFSELSAWPRFDALSDAERVGLAQRLAAALGSDYEATGRLAGEARLCTVLHVPSDCEFVAVCGGSFEMGFSDADIEALSEVVNWTNGVAAFVKEQQRLASPVHRVEVSPFLMGTNPIIDPVGGGFDEVDEGVDLQELVAMLAAAPSPMRLPSEAEFEYVSRAGGVDSFVDDCAQIWQTQRLFRGINRWGIAGLTDGEWVADAWHDNYDGAPNTAVAWDAPNGPGVFRGMLRFGPEQDDEELISALAALRGKPASNAVYRFRMAISLSELTG